MRQNLEIWTVRGSGLFGTMASLGLSHPRYYLIYMIYLRFHIRVLYELNETVQFLMKQKGVVYARR